MFERLGKRIYITNPGKKLLFYARHIIKLQQAIERVMQEERDAGGVLRIGASVTIGTCILTKIIQVIYYG